MRTFLRCYKLREIERLPPASPWPFWSVADCASQGRTDAARERR